MGGWSRAELEDMWQRWLDGNADCEKNGDWGPLADFYAPDATYGWMYAPDEHFMAVGREQIRAWALGTEMRGLAGWEYPYQAVVIDEVNGMVVGFWRQVSTIPAADGEPYEVHGIGGSWFGYGGDYQWAWQRDFFDLNSAAQTFLGMLEAGDAPAALEARMNLHGPSQPGHYRRAELPTTVWPEPVARGE